MSEQIEAAREFGARLEAQQWADGVRVVIRGAMRAPVHDGNVNLEAWWAAEVYYSPRQRRPSFTFLAETLEQLFAELAQLAAGEVSVGA